MHSIHKIPWEMKDGSDLKTHSHFDLDRSKPNRLESVLGNIVWINLFGNLELISVCVAPFAN